MKKKQPKVDLSRMPHGIDFGRNNTGVISRPFRKYSPYGWFYMTTYHVEIWKVNQRKPIR